MKRLRSLLAALLAVVILVAAAAWYPQAAEQPAAPQRLPVLRDAGPKFWKGNLHTHSLWSDGDDFPEMIADWYKAHGYDFLGLSEHNVLAEGDKWVDAAGKAPREEAVRKYAARFGPRWVERRERDGKPQVRLKPLSEFRSLLEEPGRFLLVPAEEITHSFAKAPVHINAVNLRDVIPPLDGDSIAQTMRANLRAVAAQQKQSKRRILAFVNHPNYKWGLTAEDLIKAEELGFFEVFNGHPGVRNYGDDLHPGTERIWDIVLAVRLGKVGLPVVYGLATDDAHGYHAFGVGKVNPGRGWIMVRAAYLSGEAIVRALEDGQFYASTGVTLTDIRREGNELIVSIQPEKGVTYTTQFIATMKGVSLDSEPRRDAEGKPLPVTGVYSADIGKVVAESQELEARYRLTGQELYVRARVISSKPHPNPFQKGDMEVAWIQPVVP